MTLLMNPVVLRMGLLMLSALAAFGLGFFAIRRLRKSLTDESEPLNHAPMAAEGLPVHAYHAVIQQLKQQKHELTTQQLSERRKAKTSDTLSSTVLANLSSGVLFFNTAGLVRQANSAARKLLGSSRRSVSTSRICFGRHPCGLPAARHGDRLWNRPWRRPCRERARFAVCR